MILTLQLVFKICVSVVYMCICVYVCLCVCSCLFVWVHTCECACSHMPVNVFLYYSTPRLLRQGLLVTLELPGTETC